MEPYPKSRAQELFPDEIQIETDKDPSKLLFFHLWEFLPLDIVTFFRKENERKLAV